MSSCERVFTALILLLALSGGSLKEFKKLADVKQLPVVTIVDTTKIANKDEAKITLKIVDIGGGIGDVRLYSTALLSFSTAQGE